MALTERQAARNRLAHAVRHNRVDEARQARHELTLLRVRDAVLELGTVDPLSREEFESLVGLLISFRDQADVHAELLARAAETRALLDRLAGPEAAAHAIQDAALEAAIA